MILANAWREYQSKVLDPVQAGAVQRKETKIAFYMGAMSLFEGIMGNLTEGDEVNEPDLALLDGIKTELDQFAALMKARRV